MINLPSFTAAQIAAALGVSRQAVQRQLAPIRAHCTSIVRGQEAATWTATSLPPSMLAKLNRRAKATGCLNAEHLLSQPPRRFESPIPIDQLAGPVQQRAIKLRDALARPLAELANGLKGAALEEMGLLEYERVCGFGISARHWRAVFKRTLSRDGGEEQWQRLDLYIDDRTRAPRAKSAAPKMSPAFLKAEKVLLGYASQVRQPASPTTDEKALLWNIAFEQACTLAAAGVKLSAARRAMRRALWKCGASIAKNEVSLAQLWRVKEAAWRDAGGNLAALKDGRAVSSGNWRAPEILQADIDLVIAHAVKFDGRLAQGWRHVLENRMLSAEVQAHFEGSYYSNKSYVPRAIREAARHEARQLRDIHHGPRRAKLNGAFINRDWSKVEAGDLYQADDVTLNNYYYAPDGNGGVALMRGQVLLMIDVRSTCVLGFAILDSRNYNAHAIRTLITRTCDAHGLPRNGFYFEGGIWEKSRLLKGDASVSDYELTWNESEGGLRELGLKFEHSRNPRSKPVERVIGQIQNLLDGEPGDAGRHEMKDGFERLQERKGLVERGDVPANQYFYSAEEWTARLEHFCEEYNHARNDGKMTRGLTPFQAWRNFQGAPLVKLPPEARYLLAHHKRPVKVGRNGIVLRFGNQTFTYRNAETGRRRGHSVLAWFNPELPDLLAVTDMNRQNCFTVERAEDVPAMDAPEDVLDREMGRVAAHNGYAAQRYRTMARLANLNPRRNLVDVQTAQLGQAIEAQKTKALTEREKRIVQAREGAKAFSRLGLRLRPEEDVSDEQLDAAKQLGKLLQEDTP